MNVPPTHRPAIQRSMKSRWENICRRTSSGRSEIFVWKRRRRWAENKQSTLVQAFQGDFTRNLCWATLIKAFTICTHIESILDSYKCIKWRNKIVAVAVICSCKKIQFETRQCVTNKKVKFRIESRFIQHILLISIHFYATGMTTISRKKSWNFTCLMASSFSWLTESRF